MPCECNPCGCLKNLFSQRENQFPEILCALHSAESSAFLLGAHGASHYHVRTGHLAPHFLASCLASVLGAFTSSPRSSGSDFWAPSCSTLCPLPWCEGACAARLPGTGALSPSPGPGLWEDSHGLPYEQGLTGTTTNQMSLGMVVVRWLFIWGLWVQMGCSLGGASRMARRC